MKKMILRKILSLLSVVLLLSAMAVSAGADGFPIFANDLNPQAIVQPGQTLQLSVKAVAPDGSAGAVAYQWYVNNEAVQGQIYDTFTAQYTKNTSVYCVATLGTYTTHSKTCNVVVGNDSSSSVLPSPLSPSPTIIPGAVTVVTPTITRQPGSVKLNPGQTATLSVAATCPNLGYGLELRYQWYESSTQNPTQAAPIANATSPTYTTAVTDKDKFYLVAVWSTNGYSNSSYTYSEMVGVTYGSNEFKITKHPTGETVEVGKSALFIARADNAISHEWRIVSKDTFTTVPANQAAYRFRGLVVGGETTERLSLSNIPLELDGWSVECKFTAADGRNLYTNGAVITVKAPVVATPTPIPTIAPTPVVTATPAPGTQTGNSTEFAAPVINTQPSGAVLNDSQTVTLSVAASGADPANGVTLSYQWYRNSENSNANGTAIAGATQASYIPDHISGSRYYYVEVKASNGTQAKITKSNPVTVTYTAPLSTPTPSPDPVVDRGSGLGSLIIGPIIAIVLAACAIGVGMFFLLKNVSGKKSDPHGRYYDDRDYYYRDDDYDDR